MSVLLDFKQEEMSPIWLLNVDNRHTWLYIGNMKTFSWDEDKNQKLKAERNVSFEQVVFCIENGMLLDVIEHPNPDKYNRQKIYVIEINNYVYLVPFVDQNDERFLKTIFPSRKYSKVYLSREKTNDKTR
jgi:uncharacterized DUF497 family protein